MPIPLRHLLRLVPKPLVDQSLVDSLRRTVRRERVPEDVPAFDLIPFRALQSRVKVLMGVYRPDGSIVEVEYLAASVASELRFGSEEPG